MQIIPTILCTDTLVVILAIFESLFEYGAKQMKEGQNQMAIEFEKLGGLE